jgi:hypothetical protein
MAVSIDLFDPGGLIFLIPDNKNANRRCAHPSIRVFSGQELIAFQPVI